MYTSTSMNHDFYLTALGLPITVAACICYMAEYIELDPSWLIDSRYTWEYTNTDHE